MTNTDLDRSNTKYDVAIIGAGPAGALAAKLLQDNGVSVVILEAAEFPRFSIGESLLPNSLNILERAGMLQPVVEAGFQYKNGATFERAEEIRHIDFRENYDEGWSTAYQVQRADFDKILADYAEKSGVEIRYGRSVIKADLAKNNCVLSHKGKNGEEEQLTSRFVLDASGYGRVLPRLLDLETPSNLTPRSVLFTHMIDRIADDAFDRNKILITVHPSRKDVWYWLIPFSDGTSSVGVVYSDTAAEAEDETLFSDLLNDTRLGELLVNAERTRPLGKIDGYSCNVSKLHGEGFALLGNAAEFLDPVFSSGVTIAFKSAELAIPQLLLELNGEPTDWEAEFAKPLKQGVDVFRVFVEAWYEGGLQDVVLRYPEFENDLSRMMVSILSGYAWSENSPLVQKPLRTLKLLEELCG